MANSLGIPRGALARQAPTAASADPVMRLMVDRALAGSRPGERTDNARLALAIEGGGMAGAVSAGMCSALEELGLIASFDIIYGCSAGAINASYTAAGQARQRAELYVLAAQQGVIDPRRALIGRPPFRLGEFFGSLSCKHPHAPEVLEAKLTLRVAAARLDDKGLDVLGEFDSLEELRTAVWASCSIPILAGDVVEFRGRCYVDGGLIESLPYGAAFREGATHVLVLRSRHPGHRQSELKGLRRRIADRLLRGMPETLVEMIHERPARYNAEAADLEFPERAGLAGRVAQLAPPREAPRTSQIEARPRRLLQSITLGACTVHDALTASRAESKPAARSGQAAQRAWGWRRSASTVATSASTVSGSSNTCRAE